MQSNTGCRRRHRRRHRGKTTKKPTHNLICWMFVRRQTQHNMRAMAETTNAARAHERTYRVYFRVYIVITTFVPIGNRRSAIWNKECKERNECLFLCEKEFCSFAFVSIYFIFFSLLTRWLRLPGRWSFGITRRNESTVCWNGCRHRV